MTLSPGVLASCFEMLDLLDRRVMSLLELGLSFPKIGVCRTVEIADFAERLSWVRTDPAGHAELTGSGRRILALQPHEARVRQSILDFIDEFKPAWLQNATFGRSRVLSYAGPEVKQVMSEAGLASGTDPETVAFWDMLAAMARGQKDISLSNIGRRGESLTIAVESRRTGKEPKWIALDNNADGYDVLSHVGPGDTPLLTIEVKSTTQGERGLLHITRNEWERAAEAPFHCFHLWMLLGENDRDSLLAIVNLAEMLPHVPADCGRGEWSSAAVPFAVFKDIFGHSHRITMLSGT